MAELGRTKEAIDYYRQALDLDADFGQAYSNLGLAYQKADRIAEAIWANRKAIALAFADPDSSNPGTIVRLADGRAGRIAALPFYDPLRRLPRGAPL